MICSYAFCIGDIGEALAHETGYPFIYVFQNATKSVGGTTGFVSVILILLVMITISALASSSRQMFAFARDHGLPFSKWLGTVSASSECQAHSLLTADHFQGQPALPCAS
jgi:choline transport protein